MTTVRESVDAYSWAELSAIADEISAASSDDARLEVARGYNLLGTSDKLDGTQAKTLELADGTNTSVVIAGFGQDVLTGGGKKPQRAGITFIFADAIASHAMNNAPDEGEFLEASASNVFGGWPACETRAWLNTEFIDLLPADLEAMLQTIDVTSVCVDSDYGVTILDSGALDAAVESFVETVEDRLWLPSFSQLVTESADLDVFVDFPQWADLIYNEGETYQLFAGISDKPSSLRARKLATTGTTCPWWMRTISPITFDDVAADGSANYRRESDFGTPRGIVPCFAL